LSRISGRYVLATAAVVVVGLPAGALASGEGRSLLGGTRNPAHGTLTRETEVIANNSTYGTRQSNKRLGDGGGAIYGCRSNTGNEPCVRGVNLRDGHAFAFDTKKGKEGGSITIGDPAGVPFTTNATGTVKNLSADKVDGKDSTDFAAAGDMLFAAVNADGSLGANGRGAVSSSVNGSVYTVKFNRDVSKCSYTASPVGSPSATAPGVTATPNAADSVNVELGTPGSFHLQVIC
jgi:hypothetical protein